MSRQTILIGLSGPSSSGKTTLARLLRTIFDLEVSTTTTATTTTTSTPTTTATATATAARPTRWKLTLFVLHEDDFYKTDQDVPIVSASSPEFGTRDLQDWDCVESLDLPLLERTLRHVRDHGTLPAEMASKEDQNAIGPSGISDSEVARVKDQVAAWFDRVVQDHVAASKNQNQNKSDPTTPDLSGRATSNIGDSHEIRICVLDGFLLYPEPPEPTLSSSPSSSAPLLAHLHDISRTVLDRRLFLPVTRDQMLSRRLARTGYVTLEGFWVDPPGYVEDIVWPNYARDHAWMFVGGDVEAGTFDQAQCRQQGVDVCPGQGTLDMRHVLDWAVARLEDAVVQKLSSS
ncbi:hypothetical protein A1O3_02545 [Capronia epimyces CBS 606.96]|uniref:Nicotinamide riboside kinase n=1 Tax=Capronia epimyces CBS 606.96 TaxID=1182542 RepID=W9YAE6_9EURO|nr:uncharacterized protein A1O3_02545 [Capronia epimyces CBS 606.96]EXJ89478.1 hypothetical protein A1O3_02545 [Capronia epimyces CBS 606.96]